MEDGRALVELISIGKIGRLDDNRVRVGIVLKHDVSDESRDDHGRFATGSGDAVSASFTDPAKAQEWAESHFKNASAGGYKPGHPVQEYFSFGFKQVNGFLRKPSSVDRDYHPETRAIVKAIKGEMRPVPAGGVTVYRGFDAGAVRGFGVGKQFTEKAFSSTSLDSRVARQFADQFSNGGGVLAKIEVPEGVKALYHSNDVMWGDGWSNENELLLQPGLRYEVTDVTDGVVSMRVVQR